MNAFSLRLCVLLLVPAAVWSCVDIEEAKYKYCDLEPARCLTPYFLDVTQVDVPGQDAMVFHAVARDPSPHKKLTFDWQVERKLGRFEDLGGATPSTSKIRWHTPPCMPRAPDGTHGVLVTVTATNPLEYRAAHSRNFKIPLVCPEWSQGPLPATDSAGHTATRLRSGRVLVAGGVNQAGSLKSARIYGPIASSAVGEPPWDWIETSLMHATRAYHAATLMDSGKVLLTGGYEVVVTDKSIELHTLDSVEMYDPTADAGKEWLTMGPMTIPRAEHTAIPLPSGNVLITGGRVNGASIVTSEEYSPKTGSWSPPTRMTVARAGHTATLLPSGQVLVVGGFEAVSPQEDESAPKIPFGMMELYEPATSTQGGSWKLLTVRLKQARYDHTATLLPSGKVLIAGGFNEHGPLASAELFDPIAEKLIPDVGELLTARGAHTAVLLTTGHVLAIAGKGATGPLNSTEFFSENTLGWSPGTSLLDARLEHSATVLYSGTVLVTGGTGSNGHGLATELYTHPVLAPRGVSSWIPAGDMITAQAGHTATPLDSGNVLVAGGYGFAPGYPGSIIYSSVTSTWRPTAGSMGRNRDDHTATLLPSSGQVLVAGGDGLGISELYNPATTSWAATSGAMNSPRELHTATLLRNGKVLVAGGVRGSAALPSAELYDPATSSWALTGNMNFARARHTATLLPDGKVLVTGGIAMNGGRALGSAEIYDPDAGSWATTLMPFAAVLHRAILLPNNKVLVAGGTTGTTNDSPGKSAALYDPATESWTLIGDMNKARSLPTVTLLPSNKVLFTGGDLGSMQTSSVEMYDPSTEKWSLTAPMFSRRSNHTATLMPSGNILVTGGFDFHPLVRAFIATAEVYRPQD